jgi:FMN-binding protein
VHNEIRIRFHRPTDFRAGCSVYVCSSIPDSRSSAARDFSWQIVDSRAGETGSGSTQSHRADQRCARVARRTTSVARERWGLVDSRRSRREHEFITYAVGLNANGSVKQIEVMDYRETYGGEIRNENWRGQFVGKTSESPLKLDRDIKNISGATLSCRHITDGVKRLLAFYEIALKRS